MSSTNSSSKTFKIAFLGAGNISTAHAIAIQQIPNLQVVAICDLSLERARALQQLTGASEVYQDLKTMLEKARPDVVHILLQPVLHAEAAKICLAAGSHVFLEKPFCVSSAECRDVEQAAKAAGRIAAVNHNVTFYPGLLDVIKHLSTCRLGAVEHVTIQYSLPMPGLANGPHSHWMFSAPDKIILEMGVHPLSAIYRLVGKAISAETAVSGGLNLTNGQRFYSTWQSSLVCDRGTAQMMLSLGKPYLSVWIHLLCEDGEAFVNANRYTVRYSENTQYKRLDNLVDGWRNARSLLSQSLSNFKHNALSGIGLSPASTWQQISFKNSIASFYSALAQNVEPPTGAAEGTAVLEMCEKVIAGGLSRAGEKH
jgi:predicted dehydrogenase